MDGAVLFLIFSLFFDLVAFAAFGYDKHKAVKGKWRTRESTLLFLALPGPLGAEAGMAKFHHKTRKRKFLLVHVFMVLHLVIIIYLF